MQTIINQNKGFTLIELVLVILIVSILSVSFVGLFTDTAESYLQSDARLQMTSSARIAVERIGREVREAMPNSIRVNGANNCVEFVPIVAATRYTQLPTTSPDTSITVVEPDVANNISGLNTANLFVLVIPLNINEVYNTAVGHVATVTGFTKLGGNLTEVTINSARFNRRSPGDRIFFVRQPVSFCGDGNNLSRYDNYGFNIGQPAPAAMGPANLILDQVLLNDGAAAINLFTYNSGTLNRSAVLNINFRLAGRNESIKVEHEVHVRNFP
ncbi:MAG: type II secretion system protein [Kangiellaceae bacterium]|jgi:MSHA biogenesis protein MshO|nr:type II secretion system protein [Kangiellaceae bacterium]